MIPRPRNDSPAPGTTCPRCGVIDTPTQGPGSGPHTASLRCGHCQHFLCWTSTKTPAERQARRQQALEARPPTAAQLAYLTALGDDGPVPGSLWDASQRIDALRKGGKP